MVVPQVSYASKNAHLHRLFFHVKACPNSRAHYSLYFSLVRQKAWQSAVLELGCAKGAELQALASQCQCRVAHGLDISASDIQLARICFSAGTLNYFEHDVNLTWKGKYDLIFGKGILHHLNFKPVLRTLYETNLNPGGSMVFMEPLGENILLRLYWKVGRRFHDTIERPFMASDILWMKQKFGSFCFHVCNYISLPLGVVSSLVCNNPGNAAMRFANKADKFLAAKLPSLKPNFRSAIFVIEKPHDRGDLMHRDLARATAE